MLPAQSILIGDLKFRANRRPHPRALSAASRSVESAELHPPELPPSAILIVRRIDDPLPRALQCGRMRSSQKWEQAVRQRLSGLLARADRPRWRAPSADSEAVVFADEAEMLACLAMDLREGAAHWWWRMVAKRLPSPLTVDQVLISQPRLIPAIVTELHEAGRAAAVLQTMSAETAQRVAVTMLAAFDVSGALIGSILQAVPLAALPASFPPGRPPGETGIPKATAPAWAESPLQRWLPNYQAAEGTPLIHAILIAAALGLHREPARLRSAIFGSCVLDWISTSNTAPLAPSDRDFRSRQTPAAVVAGRQSTPPTGTVLPVKAEPPPSDASPSNQDEQAPEPSSTLAKVSDVAAVRTAGSDPSPQADPASPVSHPAPEPAAQPSEPAPSPSVAPRSWPDEAIRTSFGGVFFLIHVMERLGIPEPNPVGDEITRWAWLELIARGLLERAGLLAGDPIWSALRDLDGRAEPLPTPPSTWRPNAISHIAAWLVRELAAQDLDEAVRTLLIFPAKVYITRVSVDVIASLNDTRVSVRRAGLDLDPGWQPDFGRIVQFHYD